MFWASRGRGHRAMALQHPPRGRALTLLFLPDEQDSIAIRLPPCRRPRHRPSSRIQLLPPPGPRRGTTRLRLRLLQLLPLRLPRRARHTPFLPNNSSSSRRSSSSSSNSNSNNNNNNSSRSRSTSNNSITRLRPRLLHNSNTAPCPSTYGPRRLHRRLHRIARLRARRSLQLLRHIPRRRRMGRTRPRRSSCSSSSSHSMPQSLTRLPPPLKP